MKCKKSSKQEGRRLTNTWKEAFPTIIFFCYIDSEPREMSCHFSLSCYCRAIHSLISYHPPRISVAMNWSSGAVNGSQRTQRRCELWNGSSIRGCRPHFIPPMGTMVTNWVELLFIVLIIKHSWPFSLQAEGGSLDPLYYPKSTPLIMECALVSTRQHCNRATSSQQSLRRP